MANLLICTLLFLSTQLVSVFLQDVTSDPYRLPTALSPTHYEVHLKITEEAFTANGTSYEGTVVIYLLALQNVTEIVLHSSYRFISLKEIQLNNEIIPAANYAVNSTTDILTITYSNGLTIGRSYALLIEFDGQLSASDMYGWYKSSYEDANGVTKYLATTQFQTTYARRAFPCWDEPSFKATFTILITHPSTMNALSNTRGTSRINDTTNGLTTVEFEITPIMSTYLVAFIVSEFTCSEGANIGPNPSRVCSRSETADIREWAIDVSPKIMEALDNYTAYSYGSVMAKMDQVAIPDFAAGAMENWGLVTYRETGLLYDPEESATSYRQSIAAVIAHEFTHSWFGNLVTCNWWSETFLNEGFARLLQYTALDAVLPEWELKKQFVVVVLQTIFDSDSYISAMALQSPASTPSEVSAKFGTISYSKGASVIRMLEQAMGESNFRQGIRNYLATYAFKNTLPEDLWNTLNATIDGAVINLPSGTDLNTVMANWVQKSGYPLLTVTRSGNNVIVTQERFLYSGVDKVSKWYVPVTYTISANTSGFDVTSPENWLTPDNDLTIAVPANAEWIILNNLHTGYYRVNYDLDIWTSIAQALLGDNFSGIPDVNRAGIVDDLFNLAKVDKVSYSKVFEVIEFLKNDDSYFTWYRAFTGFNYLFSRLGRESVLGQAITAHLSYLMEYLYQSVPMSNQNELEHIYTLKQVLAINWACSLGKEDCVNVVRESFNDYKDKGTSPNKNLKSIVYCNGLRYSNDSSDWNFLWETYIKTELATERAVLISALGCTRDVNTLRDYLLKSINATSGIRSQDAYSVFSAVYGNALGVDVAFDFLIENYEAIDDYYQSMNSLANIMSGIAARFTNAQQIAKLENFIATADLSESFLAAATSALGTAKTNIDWIDEYKLDLHQYYGIEEEVEVEENESSQPEYRISKIFQPSHYEIHLSATREAFSAEGKNFTGTVVIYFTVSTSTARILLHASSSLIDIESIELNNQLINDSSYSVNSTTDILRIEYPSGLKSKTQYALTIKYTGTFGTGYQGFYKSSYTINGETRYLLTTQFEPVHARKAFPCFDEPSFKATFQVIMTYPSEYNAWSNTLGSAVIIDSTNNLTTYQFEKSPIMPTYLLAFIVSDFTCTEGESGGGVPHQVCSRPDEAENRGWAVDVGSKILDSLSEFTGYNYSAANSKMDQFAIPDFSSGAMENWGLVTYREYYLLWDPAESTNSYKQSIATIIAHEFGHQWFGNLVTCSWWSEIFLNEGFATYTEFFTTHDVLPSWQLDKQFVVRVHQVVLSSDSYLTSQALQSVASTPSQISNKFGTISYSKGGSIIRMIEHFLGSENFRAGLNTYLVANQFGNTKPEDLWGALGQHVDQTLSKLPADLETVMDNWIKKSGFPILSVAQVGNSIAITQERFLTSGVDLDSKWYVPISYTTSVDDVSEFENTAPKTWLTPTSNVIIDYPIGAQWIILNTQETGYYRVNYTAELWESLRTALLAPNFSGIPELNRAEVADDVFEYTKYDKMTYTQAFSIIEFLEFDDSYMSWYVASSEFNTIIENVGLHTRLGRAVQDHVVRSVNTVYKSAPASQIDEDDQLYTLKQILAINLACKLDHQACLTDLGSHFRKFVENGILPPKNIRASVYCYGLRSTGTKEHWNYILAQYVAANTSTERSNFLSALGCIKDPEILTEFLTLAITKDTDIRSADTSSAFSAVHSKPDGVDLVFKFFVENQQAIYEYYNSWTSVSSILNGIISRFRSQAEVDEIKNLIASGAISSNIVNAANSAITQAQGRVDWVATYRADFYRYYGLTDEEETPVATTTSPPDETTEEPDGAIAVSASLFLTMGAVFLNNFYFN